MIKTFLLVRRREEVGELGCHGFEGGRMSKLKIGMCGVM